MKKSVLIAFSIFVTLGLALAIIPTTRDEIHWRWASYKDKTGNYESYVNTWPNGRHIVEASGLYDQRSWTEAQGANTVESFERYVQRQGDGKHVAEARDSIDTLRWQEADKTKTVEGFERYVQRQGNGKHVAEARDSIDSLHWQEATKANTIRSYRVYAERHPQGRFVQEAKTKLSALRVNKAPFVEAFQTGTENSLKKFLGDFPGHEKEAEAQLALKDITEGRDIVDLLKEKKIEITSKGSGIQSVSVNVRRLVPYPLTVRIPVGTYFVSANTSSQNMVTTAESRIRLNSNNWQEVSPDAACANRPRDIPSSDDKFTVLRSPHQPELAKLIPVLDKARVDTETRQAAVWIVTDDADYDDLGILVASQTGFGGSRVINETETARAMRICDEAGINITRKNIWRDKQKILGGLTNGDLKKWLQGKK